LRWLLPLGYTHLDRCAADVALADGKRRAAGLARHVHRCQLDPSERSRTLSTYILKLYVTGKTPRAEKAIANLRRICEEELHGQYELNIIDVLEHPQLAEDEKILATPTLIKRLPPPLRRVIGDLSDKEKVLLGLDVWPDSTPSTSANNQP
jgi:circadian clock protein KaiB